MSGIVVVEPTSSRLAPPPDDLAAIVAALDIVIARSAAPIRKRTNAWRFSGRSWDAPRALVRDRPLRGKSR